MFFSRIIPPVRKLSRFPNPSETCALLASRKGQGGVFVMSIDKNKITTQDELDEPAPIDQVEKRVEAEMKELERAAKRDVAEGLGTEDPSRKDEGRN